MSGCLWGRNHLGRGLGGSFGDPHRAGNFREPFGRLPTGLLTPGSFSQRSAGHRLWSNGH
jgi:hypothetical protein